jgi:phage replication O-like protein O
MSNPYIPNSAPIPNILIDYWMARLTPAEFKVLIAIARKTYGWQKARDRISIRQLTELTGLHKTGVIKAADNLVEMGLVIKLKFKDPLDGSDAPNQYEINIDCEVGGAENNRGGSSLKRQGGVDTVDTPRVDTVDTQKTLYTKDTIQKREGDEPPPLASSSKKQKKEKPKVEKIAYRDNIFLTEKEYLKLLQNDGEDKLKWKLDCLHAKKGAKGYEYDSDYHVLLPSNWVEKEYLAALGKSPRLQTVNSEAAFRNKKIAESAEEKLNNFFTGRVFFQASVEKALLVHLDKDIKKEFEYDAYETVQFKQLLLKELEGCFPNARAVLTGKTENKVSNLINDLASKFKVQEAV